MYNKYVILFENCLIDEIIILNFIRRNYYLRNADKIQITNSENISMKEGL